MFSARGFWLKFSETLCLFLVVIGLMQASEATSRWQFEVASDWAKFLPVLAGSLLVSFIVAYGWQRSERGGKLHGLFQTIIAFYVAYSITGYGAAACLRNMPYLQDTTYHSSKLKIELKFPDYKVVAS